MNSLCNVGFIVIAAALSGCGADGSREKQTPNAGAESIADGHRSPDGDRSSRAATVDRGQTGDRASELALPEAGGYRQLAQCDQGRGDFTAGVAGESDDPGCNYDVSGRNYVGRSTDECSRIMFLCVEGTTMFTDACGCGCAAE